MTFVELAPWITSSATLFQVGTVRKHPVLGFSVGLAIQPLWIWLSIVTQQWGFLLATGGFIVVNSYNLVKVLGADRQGRERQLT